MKATIHADVLVRILSNAAPFAETGRDILPALNVVRLEAGHGVITATATDRYTLAQDRGEAIGELPATSVTLADVKQVIAAVKSKQRGELSPLVTLTLSGDTEETARLTVSSDGRTLTLRPEGGAFPSLRTLWPREYSVAMDTPAAFNPAFMARFGKVRTDVKGAPMRLAHAVSATKPFVWEIGDTFTCLVMPVRLSGGESRVPFGISPATPAEETAA